MSLSNDASQEEARIAARPLYRAGQTPPAPKAPAPAKSVSKPTITKPTFTKAKVSAGGSSEKPSLFKRIRLGLLVLLALLGLAGISYCIFAPDPVDEARKDLAALRDSKLTGKERREKVGEIMGSLNEKQKNELFKDRFEKRKQELKDFFALPKERQIAKLKKDIKEGEERRAKWKAQAPKSGNNSAGPGGGRGGGGPGGGGPGGGGPGGGGPGGGGPGAGGRGPGGGGPGGGFGGGGPGGWGRGGGGDRNLAQKTRLDAMDPETRAQFSLYRSMMSNMRQSMGFGGGRGGPPR